MKNPRLAIALIFVSGWVASSQDLLRQPAEQKVPTIQLENVPLTVAIENLGRLAEFNFTIDPKIAVAGNTNTATPVNVRWENLTAKKALDRILKERGLFLVENPQTSVAKITLTNSPARVFDKEFLESSKNVIPLVTMMEVPLALALADLGKKAGMQFQLDPALSDSSKRFNDQVFVSVRFANLTASQAVAAICDQHNLQIVKSDKVGIWNISPSK